MPHNLTVIDKSALVTNPFFITAILLMSVVPQETGQVVSPIMANIMKAFPNTSATTISYIISLPSLAGCICALICGKLSVTVSIKKLSVFGLCAYIIGGSGCGLIENIYWMLSCRFILGIGFGFCIPLTQGLIAEYYNGARRASMMGYAQAVGCIGAAIFAFAAGYIALINWRSAFLLYLFPIIVLILIVRMLPDTKQNAPSLETVKEVEGVSGEKRNMDFGVYFFSATGFVGLALYLGMLINLSSAISFRGLGNSSHAGIALAIMSICTGISALLFGMVFRVGKVQTLTIVNILFGLTNILIADASSIYVIYVSMGIYGIATGLNAPCLGMAVSALAKTNHKSFALGILNSATSLGGFAASLAMGIMFGIVGAGNYRGYFMSIAIMFIIIAISMALYIATVQNTILRRLQAAE
jgi:MFS family permease